jgi:zinc transport system ATP-binding protein
MSLHSPLLELKNLEVGYLGKAILPPISFVLKGGEVTSIIGHNGSGKSTLLKTLLNLTSKVSGEVLYSADARIGYVPQREGMDPIYPVRVIDLVETGRYGIRGVGRSLTLDDRDKITSSMNATGILPLANRLFRTLSGGEQQRALLARALCTEPTILILDEPTASMDEKGAKEAMALTLDLAKKQGAAILMVNHFIDLVAQISDQVVLLNRDHQTVQTGIPALILKNRGQAPL